MSTERGTTSSDKPRVRWQFKLRTLFVIVIFIGLLTGWMVDRWRLQQKLHTEQEVHGIFAQRYKNFVKWYAANHEGDNHPPAVERLIEEVTRR